MLMICICMGACTTRHWQTSGLLGAGIKCLNSSPQFAVMLTLFVVCCLHIYLYEWCTGGSTTLLLNMEKEYLVLRLFQYL